MLNQFKQDIINNFQSQITYIRERIMVNSDNIQAISNEIELIWNWEITNSTHILFIKELNNLCDKLKLSSPGNFFIIAGDLNARHADWGNTNFNQRGLYLYQWLNNDGITYKSKLLLQAEATFGTISYLDICLSDVRWNFANLINSRMQTIDYSSDHKAIKMEILLSKILHQKQKWNNHHFF